jgi:hypothetical protein
MKSSQVIDQQKVNQALARINEQQPHTLYEQLAGTLLQRCQTSAPRLELFFNWIKQNLKIKSSLGTSRNTVMTQIWIAICIYLLLAYLKFSNRFDQSLIFHLFKQGCYSHENLWNSSELNKSMYLV